MLESPEYIDLLKYLLNVTSSQLYTCQPVSGLVWGYTDQFLQTLYDLGLSPTNVSGWREGGGEGREWRGEREVKGREGRGREREGGKGGGREGGRKGRGEDFTQPVYIHNRLLKGQISLAPLC